MRYSSSHPLLTALVLAVLFPSVARADIIFGQIDTFQDGLRSNWANGGLAPDPVVIPTGGPAGEDDQFLLMSADGGGPGGRLTMFNRVQWRGNYLGAGVGAIEMDLKNFGSADLSMRVALKRGTGMASPGYATTTAFDLPADGEWHHALFLLDAESLTRVGSTTLTLDELLSNTAELRILHSRAPSLRGDFIATQVGVDNIAAGAADAVPAPGGLALSLVGFVLTVLGRSVRRRT